MGETNTGPANHEVDFGPFAGMIQAAITDKNRQAKIITAVGGIIQEETYTPTPYALGQLGAYNANLQRWYKTRTGDKIDNTGYAFEILLKHMIATLLPPDNSVALSPAAFDFVGWQERLIVGSSVDLIIAKNINPDAIHKPILAINTKFIKDPVRPFPKNITHLALAAPLIRICASDIFADPIAVMRQFGASPEPEEFARQIANEYQNMFTVYLEELNKYS